MSTYQYSNCISLCLCVFVANNFFAAIEFRIKCKYFLPKLAPLNSGTGRMNAKTFAATNRHLVLTHGNKPCFGITFLFLVKSKIILAIHPLPFCKIGKIYIGTTKCNALFAERSNGAPHCCIINIHRCGLVLFYGFYKLM